MDHMVKRVFLICCSVLMISFLCGFKITVPNEWLERDVEFSITAPYTDVDPKFSIRSEEKENSIQIIPIPNGEQFEDNGIVYVPILPPDNNRNRQDGIINAIPVS